MPSVHFVCRFEVFSVFSPSFPLSRNFVFSSPDVFFRWKILPGGGGEFSESLHAANWRLLNGESSGKSWLVAPDAVSGEYSLCETADCSFACSALSGWPALLVEFYIKDSFDRVDFLGCAAQRLPLASGFHQLRLNVTRPRGTFKEHLMSKFIGGAPRYEQPAALLSGDSRYGHPTISVGFLDCRLDVLHRGFQALPHIKFLTTPEEAEKDSSCLQCPPTIVEAENPPAPQPVVEESAADREARLLSKAQAIHQQRQQAAELTKNAAAS